MRNLGSNRDARTFGERTLRLLVKEKTGTLIKRFGTSNYTLVDINLVPKRRRPFCETRLSKSREHPEIIEISGQPIRQRAFIHTMALPPTKTRPSRPRERAETTWISAWGTFPPEDGSVQVLWRTQLAHDLGRNGNAQKSYEGAVAQADLGKLSGRNTNDLTVLPDHKGVVCHPSCLDQIANSVFERFIRFCLDTFLRSHFYTLPVLILYRI